MFFSCMHDAANFFFLGSTCLARTEMGFLMKTDWHSRCYGWAGRTTGTGGCATMPTPKTQGKSTFTKYSFCDLHNTEIIPKEGWIWWEEYVGLSVFEECECFFILRVCIYACMWYVYIIVCLYVWTVTDKCFPALAIFKNWHIPMRKLTSVGLPLIKRLEL